MQISAVSPWLPPVFTLYKVYVLAATAWAFSASWGKEAGISARTTPTRYSPRVISRTVSPSSTFSATVPSLSPGTKGASSVSSAPFSCPNSSVRKGTITASGRANSKTISRTDTATL